MMLTRPQLKPLLLLRHELLCLSLLQQWALRCIQHPQLLVLRRAVMLCSCSWLLALLRLCWCWCCWLAMLLLHTLAAGWLLATALLHTLPCRW